MSELKKDVVKGKYVLEFDKPPAFLFVSNDGMRSEMIYIDGERVKNWRSLSLESKMDEFTTFNIDYVAFKEKEEQQEKKDTPHLDELSKGLRTYLSHHGCVPHSIGMNPVYFGELSIETINSSVISSGPKLGDIRFGDIILGDIPIKITNRIDGYSIN